MKKVIVLGCPGSGKSTFSRALQKRTGLPLFYLDQMNWNPDRTTVEKSVFLERLREAMGREEWIRDGNYGSTIELRLQACDTVFFLDYPVEVCLDGIRQRQGKAREDMPWVEGEQEEDADFLTFIRAYPVRSRPKVLELLARYPDKETHIFLCRSEADAFLERL